jgi:hypothetical protein
LRDNEKTILGAIVMTAIETSEVSYWMKALHELISPNFMRAEPRQRAWSYMCGLAGEASEIGGSRRNIASYTNERRADGAQRLLTMAQWDEDQVRANVLGVAREYLGLTSGHLYITEATFVKKGPSAVAVERQFSVDNRRLENCQIAVLMFYASAGGSLVLIDAVPYLPPSWLEDPGRRRKVSIPPDLCYRTKSQIAADMVERVIDSGLEPRQAFFSLLCQDKLSLRRILQERNIPYLISLTFGEFQRLGSADSGGHILDIGPLPGRGAFAGRPRLVEQCVSRPPAGQVSPYTAYCCAGTYSVASNAELSHMIFEMRQMQARWRSIRSEIRLDHYEVRSWRGWHRHMTLAMVVQIAMELAKAGPPQAESPGLVTDSATPLLHGLRDRFPAT